MFLLCSNWVQLWRRLRVWIRHIYLPMSRTRPDRLDHILAHLHLETLDPGISTLGLEMSTFTFWSVSMIVIWHVWIYRWFCWPATSSRDPFMKFQLLAFIFPTLACVHFLLAASWFLFALSGPLFFTFMSVQILTSFYLKILYSILSLSRALSGPLFFLFNCRSNSWLFSLIICAALSLQFWVCNFMRHLNVRLGILVSMSSLRAVFLFCQATRYMYIRLAQATICAIAIDHRVVFWLVKICPLWHFPTFQLWVVHLTNCLTLTFGHYHFDSRWHRNLWICLWDNVWFLLCNRHVLARARAIVEPAHLLYFGSN